MSSLRINWTGLGGQRYLEGTLSGRQSRISGGGLSRGYYLLTVSTGQGLIRKKILKL